MARTNSYAANLYCPKCGREYSISGIHQLCDCGSPLLVKYDLERAKGELKKEDFKGRKYRFSRGGIYPHRAIEKSREKTWDT